MCRFFNSRKRHNSALTDPEIHQMLVDLETQCPSCFIDPERRRVWHSQRAPLFWEQEAERQASVHPDASSGCSIMLSYVPCEALFS